MKVESMIAQDFVTTKPETLATETDLADARSATVDVSVIGLLTQLAHGKWLVAKVTVTLVLIGGVLFLVLPARYKAETTIMSPQQTQSASTLLMNQIANSGTSSLAAAVAGGGLGIKNPNDTYIGLLKSRPVADAILKQFDLNKVYHARDMTAARRALAAKTEIVSDTKSGFITISISDSTRWRSAAIANAYTDQLRVLTKTLAATEASQRRLFYEDQLLHAREALVSAELAFQQVQQQKGMVQLDAQAKVLIEGLATLRAQVAAKEVELQALRSWSTERNPDVQLAERELSSMQGEVSRLEQRSHSSGVSDLELGDVPSAGVDYLRADHEVRYRQAMFDLLMKQYDAAKLDESKQASIIQVVEPAIEPDRRSFPKLLPILLIAVAGGLFVGSFLALLPLWLEFVHSDHSRSRQVQELKKAVTEKMGRGLQ